MSMNHTLQQLIWSQIDTFSFTIHLPQPDIFIFLLGGALFQYGSHLLQFVKLRNMPGAVGSLQKHTSRPYSEGPAQMQVFGDLKLVNQFLHYTPGIIRRVGSFQA